MKKEHVACALLAMGLTACSSVVKQPPEVGAGHRTVYDECKVNEFPGCQWVDELAQIYEPIVVRQIRGKIICDNWQGSWEPVTTPILELRSSGKSSKIKQVRCDASGLFSLKGLPEGRYCFLASAGSGYDGAYGIIIIDKKSDPRKEIEIVLGLAVP